MRKALTLAALLATTSAPAWAATNFPVTVPGTVTLENHSFYQITNRIIDVFWDATLQCTGNDTQLQFTLPRAAKAWYVDNAADRLAAYENQPNGVIARDIEESKAPGPNQDNELARSMDPRFIGGKLVFILGTNNPCIPGRTFSFTAHTQYVF